MGFKISDIILDSLTADPTSPEDGCMWYRSDLGEFRKQENGTTKKITNKFSRSIYAYNMDGVAGTYNTVVCAASAATTILYERHLFKAFDKNIEEAIEVNVTLPNSYTAGTDIKITLITTDNTAAENVRWQVGLTQLTSGGAFSDDTDTEYQGVTVASSTGWEAHTTALTFSGTNLSPNEPIAIIIFRDTQHIDDNLNSDAYLNQILIEEV